MGRLTQAMAFIEVSPENLTGLWKKAHLKHIAADNKAMLKLRKERLNDKRVEELRDKTL